MKIVIHGATNGSNFGDCIFAHIFYQYFQENNHQVSFVRMPRFGISPYLINELNIKKTDFYPLSKANALIYMSGGYFGDTKGGLRETIKRYIRYFLVAEYFIFAKKTIYVCGVGGGPVKNKWLLKKMVRVLNHAEHITVRDPETAEYFAKSGVNKKMMITIDTALCLMNPDYLARNDHPEDSMLVPDQKKILFLHVYGADASNREILRKIVPAVNRFLSLHNEYIVWVGTDNISKKKIEDLEVYNSIHGEKKAIEYESTAKMLSVLKLIDCAITVKLHVGILSAAFGKSVVSFPEHKFKTHRFYKQINEEERCKQISECSADDVYHTLCRFVDSPIKLPDDMINLAEKNLKIALRQNCKGDSI